MFIFVFGIARIAAIKNLPVLGDSLPENAMIDTRTAPYAALLLRIALGVMFLAHGLTKLLVFTLPGTAQFFAKIGFAGWLAYPVTFFEIGAGALLILGVWPRWIAVIAAVQLFVASSVHFGNGWGFGNRAAAGNIRCSWPWLPRCWRCWATASSRCSRAAAADRPAHQTVYWIGHRPRRGRP